jgi:hypothetical protein
MYLVPLNPEKCEVWQPQHPKAKTCNVSLSDHQLSNNLLKVQRDQYLQPEAPRQFCHFLRGANSPSDMAHVPPKVLVSAHNHPLPPQTVDP